MIKTKFTRKIVLGAICAASVSTISLGFGATAAGAAEVDGPKVKWLVSLWGNRRGQTEGMEKMAEIVSQKTDGNFELSLQYGGVLSDPKENIDGLQLGAFEAGMFCPIYHPSKTPALGAIDLAYLPIEGMLQRAKVYQAFYQVPAVAEEFARWNSVPMIAALLPAYQAMGRGDAPMTKEAWKGLRLNASGGVAALFGEGGLGASTTTIPAPDMYQALERGLVDGLVYPYTYAFAAYRLHEVSDWVTQDWTIGSLHCAIAANKDAYEALPQQYRDLLAEAVMPSYEYQIAQYAEIDEKNEKIFTDVGLVRIPVGPEISTILQAAAKPSWDAWVTAATNQGLPAQELLNTVLKLAEENK